uniref:Uncharacterized protein n=1 Tax=Arundo donax TaxID=35708 RepID=A0A0A9BE32_ARUDO
MLIFLHSRQMQVCKERHSVIYKHHLSTSILIHSGCANVTAYLNLEI